MLDRDNPEVLRLIANAEELVTAPGTTTRSIVTIDRPGTRMWEDGFDASTRRRLTTVGMHVSDATLISPHGEIIDDAITHGAGRRNGGKDDLFFDRETRDLLSLGGGLAPSMRLPLHFETRGSMDNDNFTLRSTRFRGLDRSIANTVRHLENTQRVQTDISHRVVAAIIGDLVAIRKASKVGNSYTPLRTLDDLCRFYAVLTSRLVKSYMDEHQISHFEQKRTRGRRPHATLTNPLRRYDSFATLHNLAAFSRGESLPFATREDLDPRVDSTSFVQYDRPIFV